ncbi:MAG: DUF4153 domain-containing protein [Gammaproteobacteria bacterium]|nr:DUF4153 domain-containing protein [Gammaproteobacteria bacterium]
MIDKFRGHIAGLALAVFAAVVAMLAAYQGAITPPLAGDEFSYFPFWTALAVIWFIALPFLQARLATNTWTHYGTLFRYSWQNAFFLAEAALFTGVFWLLLLLWAQLFLLIDITFFRELFLRPAFSLPVSAIVFSGALTLVAAREDVALVLRRHVLGIFLWLLPLVAFIAAIFLIALPFQGLSYIGKAGISTGIMLWTIAFLIKFYNAAYQDGETPPPYPLLLRNMLRVAVVTLIALASLGIYGLSIRISQHGWSVERVWAVTVAVLGLLYGVGYAAAAWRRGPWMHAIGKTNLRMALVCLGVLLLLLSPALSPYKISLNSQIARLMDGRTRATDFDYAYLRFSLGKPGHDALTALLQNQTHADKDVLHERAAAALAMENRWDISPVNVGVDEMVRRLVVVPAGAVIDPSFIEFLKANRNTFEYTAAIVPSCGRQAKEKACKVFSVDLDGDGDLEILVGSGWSASVFSRDKATWKRIGDIDLRNEDIEGALALGNFKLVTPQWKDLKIGGRRYHVVPID